MKAAIFIFFVCFAANAFAQSDISIGLQKDYQQYRLKTVQEKLFIHTDKSFYTAGEIMWFKIYDVEAATNKPADVSKVTYVEIVNSENKPVLQAKIRMQNGAGNGSFFIPFSTASGNYVLKGYTNWMKNSGSDYFFEKPVTIVNTLKSEEAQTVADTASYDIQFFPEGGNLVSGIQSTVACKAVNQYGQGVSFTGFLLNQNNDTIVRFQPFKFGIGRFDFTPSVNDKYRAVVKMKSKTITTSIPKIYEQGYVMKLAYVSNTQLSVRVSTNISNPDPYIYLFVHSQQSVQSVQVKQLINGRAEFMIDKSSLDEGISHITCFNSSRQPLCERLCCKQPKQKLSIDIKADETSYNERKKVQLTIDTRNQLNQPSDANLSLSVFRLDSLQGIDSTNIFSYVWLSSELKGSIESPDYYLDDTSNERREALDNLMLTQGWRRFRWEDVLQNKQPSFRFLPEYEGQIITANIAGRASGLPARDVTAYLSIPGEKFQFGSAVSDDSGTVKFVANHFFGAGEAVIQTSDTTGNAYQVTFVNPFSQTPFQTSMSPFSLLEKWKDQLLDNSISVQSQNAYLSDERQHFLLLNEGDTAVFYGKPDKRYLLDDYSRFPTMEEVMREYVTEVRLSKTGNNYHYTVDNLPYKEFFKNSPLVLLDGVPVWNTDRIIALNPLKVRQLDVVTHKYYLGNQTYDGMVSYSTYNGDIGGIELNPGAIQVEYEGLQLEREFYTPVYETPQQINRRIPDFRNLLYWSPDIDTDSSGRQTLSFYTSDLPGNYVVVVQGNTAAGLAGSKVMTFNVSK